MSFNFEQLLIKSIHPFCFLKKLLRKKLERDPLFEDAARFVVQYQLGSTSALQRKFKLGYDRASCIIDQLEAAGIIGPLSDDMARDVKVADEIALQLILKDLELKDKSI